MASDEELLDLDEDLFDFDELLRDAQLFDEPEALHEPEAQPAQARAGESPPAPLPVRAQAQTSFTPPKRPPPLAPPTPPRTVAPATARATREPASQPVAAAPVGRRFALSRGLALALGLAVALNLVLVLFVARALQSVQGMVNEVGGRMISTTETVRDATADIARTFGESTAPIVSPRGEGLTALERARGLVAQGEYQRARETLYALLAVADRLEAASRNDVEAQARFLIADSWRLEANAFERDGLTRAQPEEDAR